MKDSKIYAIVLNWENYEDTKDCIRGLNELKTDDLSIILVDNGSSDGSGKRLDEEFPDVKTIFKQENSGFAKGINTGIRKALNQGADYILICNNDLVIDRKKIVSRLVDRLSNNMNLDIISPVIRNVSSGTIWFEKGIINWELGKTKHKSASDEDQDMSTCDYVPFACCLIDSEVFKNVGYLPTEYFLYYEDADFCTTAKESGYQCMTDLSVSVGHKKSASTQSNTSEIYTYYMIRNTWIFFKKRSPKTSPMLVLSCIYQSLFILAKSIYNKDFKASLAGVRGLIDAGRNKEGKGPYPK